jgi:hypothetical protein
MDRRTTRASSRSEDPRPWQTHVRRPNERESQADDVRSDEQIVAAHLSFLFETGTEQAIHRVGGFFERQELDRAKHDLSLCR